MTKVYLEAKRQVEQFKDLIEQIEIAGKNALKLENEMWQSVIEELIVILNFDVDVNNIGQQQKRNAEKTRRSCTIKRATS